MDLERVSREQGLTPDDWIATALPSGAGSIEPQARYGISQEETCLASINTAVNGHSGKATRSLEPRRAQFHFWPPGATVAPTRNVARSSRSSLVRCTASSFRSP